MQVLNFFFSDICAKEEKSQKIYTTIIIPEGEDDFKQLHEFLCNH